MINSVVDGIIGAVSKEFLGACIYTEEVLQGLSKPCFFVYCVNPIVRKYVGSRCLRKNVCVVQYFAGTSEKKREYNDVTDRLIQCLEYITVGDRVVMGSDVKVEVIDSVLNVRITYSMWDYGHDNGEKMERLEMM